MRSGLASLCCFRILPEGILVHYVSALKIGGIGKKLPHVILFPSHNVTMATQHPSLVLSCPTALAAFLEAASLEPQELPLSSIFQVEVHAVVCQ